jgi:hypothetical protein
MSEFAKNSEFNSTLQTGVRSFNQRTCSTSFDQRRVVSSSGVVVNLAGSKTYQSDGSYGLSDYYPLTVTATGLLQVDLQNQRNCGDVIILDAAGSEVMIVSPTQADEWGSTVSQKAINSSGLYSAYIQVRGRSSAKYVIDVSVVQPVISGDPYFNSVSLLLHGEGTDGSTSIIDSSPRTKTVVASGTTAISTTQAKFGSSSIGLGSAGSLVTSTASNEYSFGTGDFTAEAWIYYVSNTGETRVFSFADGAPNTTLNIGYGFTANRFTIVNEGVAHIATSSVGFTPNVWQHVAFTRASDQCRLFLNGSGIASVVSNVGNNSSGVFTVGYGSFNAYYDEVRVTKGIARYSSDFTPPSSPFPDSL